MRKQVAAIAFCLRAQTVGETLSRRGTGTRVDPRSLGEGHVHRTGCALVIKRRNYNGSACRYEDARNTGLELGAGWHPYSPHVDAVAVG
ncbi:hypothetical protein ElyMa_000743900 [Elysia marginata]|uniref:Uncharacterized protein n=1 Tax=Elysia marginata TaxID=1093978 RepID=A0AAV4GP26_9GAST|nr:hypothetical protein ElyMa_000743900 [Elysia marginata]